MDILKLVFVIFLGTFFLGEVIRFDLGNNFVIKPVDLAIVALFLIWVVQRLKRWKKVIVLKDNLILPIILVMATMCLSLASNLENYSQNEILVAVSYILRWILYMNLYFIVKSFSIKFKEKITYLLLIVGALFILFGFMQYFFYSNLRNIYYLGWDEHMYRMFSTFLDPNFAGSFFVLYLIFLSGMFLCFLRKNRIKEVWLIGFACTFSLMSIYLTYSRSALIMLFSSAAFFSVFAKKIYWFFAIVFISLFFILISEKNFNVENINLFRIASAEARIDSAKIAIQIINDNPFLGVGFNAYRYAQIKYGFRNPVSSSISHADAGTDNSFLFLLATTGVIGSVFYLNLLWRLLKKAYLNYRRNKDGEIQKYVGIITLASVAGIMIDSFFINSLFYSFIMIWMWILLGLMKDN